MNKNKNYRRTGLLVSFATFALLIVLITNNIQQIVVSHKAQEEKDNIASKEEAAKLATIASTSPSPSPSASAFPESSPVPVPLPEPSTSPSPTPSPPPLVTVPPLVNQTMADAQSQAEHANLRVVKSGEDYDEAVPQGSVCRTNPAAGNRVDAQSEVEVWISKGPPVAIIKAYAAKIKKFWDSDDDIHKKLNKVIEPLNSESTMASVNAEGAIKKGYIILFEMNLADVKDLTPPADLREWHNAMCSYYAHKIELDREIASIDLKLGQHSETDEANQPTNSEGENSGQTNSDSGINWSVECPKLLKAAGYDAGEFQSTHRLVKLH